MGTIDVPIFYGEGDDLMEWVCWIDDFASDHGFTDFETHQFAYGFIEGEALSWYGDESSRSVFKSWSNLKYRLVMRFCRNETQPVTTSRKDLLNQLSLLLDRWDEEDEAKKQLKEEAIAEGDSNLILSSVEGFVKSFEPAPPVTVLEEEDDLSTWIGTPPVVLETVDDAVICVKVREGKEQTETRENVILKTQSGDLRGNTRKKKKKRWKTPFEMQRSLDADLGFDGTGYMFGYVDSKGRVEQQRKGGKEIESEISAYQLLDQLHLRRKKITKKKKRWKKLVPDIEDQLAEILSNEESDNSDMLGIQMENTTKSQRKSWLEWGKGSCHWVHTRQRLDRKWMLMFRKKKRKRKRRTEKSCGSYEWSKRSKEAEIDMLRHMIRCWYHHGRKDTFRSIKQRKCKYERKRSKLETKQGKLCKMKVKRMKQELGTREMIQRRKRVLTKLAKWKKLKFQQKCSQLKDMILSRWTMFWLGRKKHTNRRSSARLVAFLVNLVFMLKCTGKYFLNWCKKQQQAYQKADVFIELWEVLKKPFMMCVNMNRRCAGTTSKDTYHQGRAREMLTVLVFRVVTGWSKDETTTKNKCQDPHELVKHGTGSTTSMSLAKQLLGRDAMLAQTQVRNHQARHGREAQSNMHRREAQFKMGKREEWKLKPCRKHSVTYTLRNRLSLWFYLALQLITRVSQLEQAVEEPVSAVFMPTQLNEKERLRRDSRALICCRKIPTFGHEEVFTWKELTEKMGSRDSSLSLYEKVVKSQGVYRNTSLLPSAYAQGMFESSRPPETYFSHAWNQQNVWSDCSVIDLLWESFTCHGRKQRRITGILAGMEAKSGEAEPEAPLIYRVTQNHIGRELESNRRVGVMRIEWKDTSECYSDLEDKVSFNGAGIDTYEACHPPTLLCYARRKAHKPSKRVRRGEQEFVTRF